MILKSISAAGLMALFLCTGARAETFIDGVTALQGADYPHALSIFSQAAAQGDGKSQFALAEMYRQGQGAPRDDAQALAWYRKAADQGIPGAEFRLGFFYQAGQGVRRDARVAESWYAKAAGQGYEDAQARLDEMTHNAPGASSQRFFAMMDRVFGPGRWRETSGYRTPAQEDALRKQGAGTVRLGERSLHSIGGRDAPGAYDIVVAGMSPERAAAKLRVSGEPLARVVAEAAHGTQGPHLHIEPGQTRGSGPAIQFADVGRRRLETTDGAPARLIPTATTSAPSR